MISTVRDIEHLEDLLSEPSPGVVEAMARLEGDLILLGVAGKMGPTLARMARRASEAAGVRRRIFGVARFSTGAETADQLTSWNIEPIACDLLDPAQLSKLPHAANVLFMTGMKFGSTGQEARTWAMNVHLPALVCQAFRGSRIVAFSTGNVYGLAPVTLGGSLESDALRPVGEYSISCLGRERIFEHFSRTWDIPMAILRLNYACELRYGVLVDLAQRVLAGQNVDATMGHLNAIWQADANAMTLQSFHRVSNPPFVLNLAGPETLSVRRLAEQVGTLAGCPAMVQGTESPDAYLSNAQLSHRLFGYPRVSANEMLCLIVDWLKRGGETLGKPTHFEVRDGKF